MTAAGVFLLAISGAVMSFYKDKPFGWDGEHPIFTVAFWGVVVGFSFTVVGVAIKLWEVMP